MSAAVAHDPVRRLFDELLPVALVRNPGAARAIGGTYRIDIVGRGSWTIELNRDPPRVTAASVVGCDVAISIGAADMDLLLTDPENKAIELYFAGRIEVSGDFNRAMELGRVLSLAMA